MTDIFSLSHVASACLIFTTWQVLCVLILLGLISKRRELMYWGVVFLNLSTIINYALKITFKVPLPSFLHQGFAFPSGHMQMTTFFYGWLALHAILKMQYWVGFICVAEAFGLIYFHYHTPLDVLAGFATALFLLSIFYTLFQNYKTKKMMGALIIFVSICLAYIVLDKAQITPNYIYIHAALFYSLLFLVLLYQEYERFKSHKLL
jgi:membrane-associated phospholipid phosphatase